MKRQSVRKQAAILACANALTRALGFVLRIVLSRLMGAEAVGVMELSHSAHMLSITPVTAGFPLAVSRLTARDRDDRALRAGRQLIRYLSLMLMPAWLLVSPVIAYALRDLRVLPSLVLFTPCILILGLSAVYNGYCYGSGNAYPPALSELMEQVLRFLLSAALLVSLPRLSVAGRAAVPALSTAAAEGAGLLLVIFMLRKKPRGTADLLPVRREIWQLSLPLMVSRLLTTLLRAASGALIPLRLMASGLQHTAAMERFGMLQGMVMPVLFLPGIVTGALGTVSTSAIAARQGSAQRRMALSLFISALLCGGGGVMLIHALAPFLAERVYHLPALTELFHAAAPLTLFFALQHAANGVISGLGKQKRQLPASICGAALSLICMYLWAARPDMRILGAVRAMILGQALTLLWSLVLAWKYVQ